VAAASETTGTREPRLDEEAVGGPATAEPVAEEPVAEEPVAGSAEAGEPMPEPAAAQEPVAELAVAEEPGAEEAVAEESETAAPEAVEVAGVDVVELEPLEEERQAEVAGAADAPAKKDHARPGIESDDTMDEAARKTLLFHFGRMVRHESGTREGEDAEELHDMRVATRRMRAALRVFDGHVDGAVMKPYLKALRRTGRTLGTVRDLDVFYEKTARYLDTLTDERRDERDDDTHRDPGPQRPGRELALLPW